uniref:T9SS type A sorting domain-containing protein n=1 Tax=Ignavibacterium album TaxID=591197 RepID=A0A832G6G1_9BACT
MKKYFYLLSLISLICLNTFSEAQTWTRKNAGYGFWSIEKDYAGNIYAGTTGTARGIFKSTDGGETWTNVFSTGASNYLDIAFDPQNNVYVANSSNGLIISTDGGNSFTTIPSSTFGGNAVNTVACGPNGLVLVGVTSGGVYRSTDYGTTFTQTFPGYSIVSLQFDNSIPDLVYAGASSTTLNGFFRSTDGGITFSSVLNPVNVWEIIQKQDGTLYTVTTTSGYPVDKSTDLGFTWTTVGNTPAAIRGACLDLVENIYAAGNGGVYKSTDGGASFTNFNLTFSSNKIISYQNKILVAVSGTTNGGIYVYTDESIPVELTSFTAFVNENSVQINWSTAIETNNRGFEIQRSIFPYEARNPVWEAVGFVNGNGSTTEPQNYSFVDEGLASGKYLYRLKQIDFDGTSEYSNEIEVEILAPTKFVLEQNYPNPFNPITIISWQSPVGSRQTLKVYDVLGNEVATLVDEYREAGRYEVEFNVAQVSRPELPSGIYLYKLTSGKFSTVRKMMLIK